MAIGIGVCPHRPWELALAIENPQDLILYFQLRLRAQPYQQWLLDQATSIPERITPVGLTHCPAMCVGCGAPSGEAGLLWGCDACGKWVHRESYFPHLLTLKVHPTVLDYSLAWALYYLRTEQ